jgi:glutathione synthase/RimK-type ligase-like ATP-grasp enzyme
MQKILVVERAENWPLEIPGAEVVSARAYLTEPGWSQRRGVRVFNVCRSYRYQSVGYYVSLLAEARGHRPLPTVGTLQDLKSPAMVKILSEELRRSIQKSLGQLVSDTFTLSIYFGRNLAEHHQRLSRQLFNLFPAPLLRAEFSRTGDQWELRSLRPIGAREIPENHRPFVVEQSWAYLAGKAPRARKQQAYRFDLALLVDPEESLPPSDEKALRRLEEAGESLGIRCERIGRDDIGHVPEFDGLFIRATTSVNHYTFRFSQRAAAEGIVVIDDPDSILRCTNKVFLTELLSRKKIPTPRTVVLHRDNLDETARTLGFPMILKLPDSSFSQGVVRVSEDGEFRERARSFLGGSDLLIAQEFLPTDFDWRVGVLNREVLFVAKYFMARGHWQIIHGDGSANTRYGGVEAVPAADAPAQVLDVALRAANLMGDGLYGVDIKVKGEQVYVVEVNDNPNLDAGYEDRVGGKSIYQAIMQTFLTRMEARRERGGGS